MALGQIAALVGSQGVKYLLDQRAKGQQERKQRQMDAMANLQGGLTGQPQRPGMAGPPGGMLGAGQQMMNDPQMQKMIQDMLFKYLFSGGQAPGGGGGMPNAQGLMTRYGG
ncbi:hypothetical protein [uncultured Mediterranean phage uvDeep-CGR2-KM23-C246]|nr:hypothetical protein [uncultured Mediterranean phage uvDeep-CGR2-KM23-C246]